MDRNCNNKNNWSSAEVEVKTQIAYEVLCQEDSDEQELINAIVNTMTEINLTNRKEYTINGNHVDVERVQAQFKKIDKAHVKYIISSMKDTQKSIKNIKAYMITALYNAPDTIEVYYNAKKQQKAARKNNGSIRNVQNVSSREYDFSSLEKQLANKI